MKKAKIVLLVFVVIGISGSVLAFRATKFNDLCYYGCGTDNKCDNAKVLNMTKSSTSPVDPKQCGALAPSAITCIDDCDCGSFNFTTDF